MAQGWDGTARRWGRAALAVLGLWLGVRVALPWLLPFVLALALAALLEPAVAGLTRVGLPRWGAAALCTAGLTGLLGGGAALALWRLWGEAAELAGRLPGLLARLEGWGGALEDWTYRLLVAAPPSLRGALEETLAGLAEQGAALPARLSQRLGEWVSRGISALPGALLFAGTTALATYFTSAGRPALISFLRRQLPLRWQARWEEVGGKLRQALGGWLRAQGILMAVTFALTGLGLTVLGVGSPLLLGGLTALVDALPVFGAGTVLLPWAAVWAVGGRLGPALGLTALYGLVCLARSLLEPKLLGDGMGLPPLAALCAMYVGFRAFGVGGMVLAPLALTALEQLHRCGLVRLWRE